MSIADDPPPPEHADLQFDRAEFTSDLPEAAHCTACSSPINDRYFEAGGKIVCETCREAIERMFRGGPRIGQAFRALAFGAVAAVAGACLYYGIMKITGLNIGLVAVVVGLMVGRAVKAGSGLRGGLFFQLMAVFLTYSAIVGMHVPFLIEAMQQFKDTAKPGPMAAEKTVGKEAKPKVLADPGGKEAAGEKPAAARPPRGRTTGRRGQISVA